MDTMKMSVAPVIAGTELPGAPGGVVQSVNPARTAEVGELTADESFRLGG
jgi:hypothetical protein